MSKLYSFDDLAALRNSLKEKKDGNDKIKFVLADGTCCRASGSQAVYDALAKAIGEKGEDRIELVTTGCHGFCQIEPNLLVLPDEILYVDLKARDAESIVDAALKGKVVEKLTFKDAEKKRYPKASEVPFYTQQLRLLTGMNRFVDPTKIDDYIAQGGYSALVTVLGDYSPEKVIETVKTSGLRGRGGGGFPTGRKWESVFQARETPKYVICNADEGDPGAYMDRSLLEGNPHLVIEGMLIAAYAMGSSQGYVYVRNEYPMAVEHLNMALEQAREYGLLGKNILGRGFDFDIRVNRGGGAFVCGESSALMASIEGNPGEPIPKYVHMAERGLFQKPTNLNNVETYANVPVIFNMGVDKYTAIGTEGSKGTKIFSLVGKIRNTGLVEVPMGITLRKIVEEIGGGIPEGKKFKAIQTGGPSGGCLPAEHLDMPVDFDKLYEVGSMMGSGGMIVLDEDNCMVDVARYFTNFLVDESCGKCTPCREGVQQLRDILKDICEGKGQEGDLELLESLSRTIIDTSLCALGQTAPNPLLTTLRFFRDEYEAHIRDKKCPAGVCAALLTFSISEEKCTGCGLCKKQCPTGAIMGKKKEKHFLDQEKCIRCGACYEVCKFDAVIKE